MKTFIKIASVAAIMTMLSGCIVHDGYRHGPGWGNGGGWHHDRGHHGRHW